MTTNHQHKRMLSASALGRRLRYLRGSRTQKDLAAALGMSPLQYNRYEKGKSYPNTETLHRLSEFYGFTVEYLERSAVDASAGDESAGGVGAVKTYEDYLGLWAPVVNSGRGKDKSRFGRVPVHIRDAVIMGLDTGQMTLEEGAVFLKMRGCQISKSALSVSYQKLRAARRAEKCQ